MSFLDNPDSILMLKKLLQPQDRNESSDSEDEVKTNNIGPSQIGPKTLPSKAASKQNSSKGDQKKDIKIDEWLEEQEKEDNDILETRKRPEYKITYKQAVGTTDLFLQMGNKTSASSSCEEMILEIKLPEETVAVHEMGISVTANEIDLTTPVYRLKLPLVHPINPDKSSAKYYTEKNLLCLTCRLNRQYDFVNF